MERSKEIKVQAPNRWILYVNFRSENWLTLITSTNPCEFYSKILSRGFINNIKIYRVGITIFKTPIGVLLFHTLISKGHFFVRRFFSGAQVFHLRKIQNKC